MVATDLKGMLSISIKSRHDGYTDQYNRIFMVKLLLVSSVVMGISWFQDSINCMVPDSHGISGGFVSSTCWIQGVYVYKELQTRVDKVAYFGIPKDMNNDGMLLSGSLCTTQKRFDNEPDPDCRPMHKTFFLQYQWMPFLIAALSILYYAPYVAFRTANSDLISLKNTVKADEPDAEKIAKSYFNHRVNPQRTMYLRIVFNILIKIFYLISNLVAFLGLDSLLNNEYVSYGSKWVSWSRLNNSMAFDYLGMRDFPKPGNLLLPPFGYCELYESAKDIKTNLGNKHKFVCELSQNILYQYCLVVLWFALVFGIVVSVLGVVLLLIHYVIGILGVKSRGPAGKKLYKALSFRELEYLEFIRKRNILLYGEVLEKLRNDILGPNAPNDDQLPLYPNMKDRYDEKGPGYHL